MLSTEKKSPFIVFTFVSLACVVLLCKLPCQSCIDDMETILFCHSDAEFSRSSKSCYIPAGPKKCIIKCKELEYFSNSTKKACLFLWTSQYTNWGKLPSFPLLQGQHVSGTCASRKPVKDFLHIQNINAQCALHIQVL